MAKLDRGIFLYLEPRRIDDEECFAQCGTCRMFVPETSLEKMDGSRCIIHGARVSIDEDDSCGFWVPWPKGSPNQQVIDDHAGEIEKGVAPSVTPEQSGLVDDAVQCRHCVQFDEEESECALYASLNKLQPKLFDLDVSVKPHACCNAWSDEVPNAEAASAAKPVPSATVSSMKQSLDF